MGFKPIPKKDLPHTVTLIHAVSKEAWEDAEYVETILSTVRLTGSNSLKYSENGAEMICSRKLFFDRFFSSPKGTSFSVGDFIKNENGEQFTIKTINPVYTDAREEKVHHWEVGLV